MYAGQAESKAETGWPGANGSSRTAFSPWGWNCQSISSGICTAADDSIFTSERIWTARYWFRKNFSHRVTKYSRRGRENSSETWKCCFSNLISAGITHFGGGSYGRGQDSGGDLRCTPNGVPVEKREFYIALERVGAGRTIWHGENSRLCGVMLYRGASFDLFDPQRPYRGPLFLLEIWFFRGVGQFDSP